MSFAWCGMRDLHGYALNDDGSIDYEKLAEGRLYLAKKEKKPLTEKQFWKAWDRELIKLGNSDKPRRDY